MKFQPISFAVIFSLLPIIAFTLFEGCKKDSTPLGVNAPLGFDFPTYTPTPATGGINVYVAVGGTYQTGVSVLLVDPTGNTLPSQLTQYQTFAAFQVSNLINGTWKAIVPSQPFNGSTGNYFYNSAITFTVNNPSGPLYEYFNAPGQSVSLILNSPNEIYSYGGGQFSYSVTYVQPGNLNVPVSIMIDPTTPLPTGWSVTFTQPYLGAGINSSGMTITLPCTWYQPTFDIKAVKADNTPLLSSSHHITRNYVITANISCNGTYNGVDGYNNNFTLLTTNDCGVTWYFNGNIQLTNGQSANLFWESPCPTNFNGLSSVIGSTNNNSGSW
jgi:hypothetical protein